MAHIRFTYLAIIVPVLCALSLEQDAPGFDDNLRGGDERATLQGYVDSLDWQCDAQIDGLATMIPTDQVDALRREHYAWRLQRDLQCKETGRKSSIELAEAECLLKMTSDYFDRREVEISEFEAELAKKLGIEKTESGEKEFPASPE
jgi:hypothetical protein